MRKVLLSLLVLALACPAFAAVSVIGVNNEDGTASLAINTDGAVVRGLALKLTLSGGATLVDLTPAYVNPAFNVFIDSAFEIGETYGIGDGTPFANADAAGEATAGATVFSISMGVLDEEGAQAGYTGNDILITFETGAGNVCMELDTLRGGIVGDGTIEASIGACFDVTAGEPECIAASHPDYAQWSLVGKPDSWCNPRQCYGDADGAQEQMGKNLRWVGLADLGILASGFNQAYSGQSWIAADFDRNQEQMGKNLRRVGLNDLAILATYFNQAVVPADCND